MRFGRPNSLLNAAAPSGPSSMMSSAGATRIQSARRFPRLRQRRDACRCETEAAQAGLRAAAAAGRAFVAVRRRRRWTRRGTARSRSDVLWVSTLMQNAPGIAGSLRYSWVCGCGRKRETAVSSPPPVAAVGRQRVLRRARMRVLDHAEQRGRLPVRMLVAAVDGPRRVEDLVAAARNWPARTSSVRRRAGRARVRRSVRAGSRPHPAPARGRGVRSPLSSIGTGTTSSAARGGVANIAAPSSRRSTSDCVIGSCSRRATALRVAASSGHPARSRRRPRSTRCTGRPAPCRSSVALLAHGEWCRGAARRRRPCRFSPGALRFAGFEDAVEGIAVDVRIGLRRLHPVGEPAPAMRSVGASARRRASSRSRRNGDRAGRPRERSSGMRPLSGPGIRTAGGCHRLGRGRFRRRLARREAIQRRPQLGRGRSRPVPCRRPTGSSACRSGPCGDHVVLHGHRVLAGLRGDGLVVLGVGQGLALVGGAPHETIFLKSSLPRPMRGNARYCTAMPCLLNSPIGHAACGSSRTRCR